jgi:hypothetical protein
MSFEISSRKIIFIQTNYTTFTAIIINSKASI